MLKVEFKGMLDQESFQPDKHCKQLIKVGTEWFPLYGFSSGGEHTKGVTIYRNGTREFLAHESPHSLPIMDNPDYVERNATFVK